MLTMTSQAVDPQYLDPAAITSSRMTHSSSSSAVFNRNEGHSFAEFLSQVEAIDAFALTANEWAGFSGATTAQNIGGVGPSPDDFKYATTRSHLQHPQQNAHQQLNQPRLGNNLEHATRSLMSLTLPVTVEHGGYQQTPTSLTFSSPATPIVPAYPAVATARAWRPYENASSSTTQIDPNLIGQGEPSTSSSKPMTKSLTKGPPTNNNASSTRKRPPPTPLASSAHPNKRPRSHSQSQSSPPTNGNGSYSTNTSTSTSKPALLTPAQKKANHIASEQKRRAKIRRGYDALCEVVPSLKAAIIAEQEAIISGSGGWNHAIGPSIEGKKGRKTRGGKMTDDVPPPTKDGSRAGPKSESIVLSQTIEHIENLLARKDELLTHLEAARSRIVAQLHGYEPPDKPVWEREWDGGTGVEEGEDDDVEEGDWEDDDQQ